jgi:hypothetical protein
MDGWIDIAITGADSLYNPHTIVFMNTHGIYSKLNFNFESLYRANISVADFDLNGYPDIFQTGMDSLGVFVSYIYYNSNMLFTKVSTEIIGLGDGTSQVLNFDSDGAPDIIVSGKDNSRRYCYVYRNLHFGNVPTTTSIAKTQLRENKVKGSYNLDLLGRKFLRNNRGKNALPLSIKDNLKIIIIH